MTNEELWSKIEKRFTELELKIDGVREEVGYAWRFAATQGLVTPQEVPRAFRQHGHAPGSDPVHALDDEHVEVASSVAPDMAGSSIQGATPKSMASR